MLSTTKCATTFVTSIVERMNVRQDILNQKKIMIIDDDQFSVLLSRMKLKKYVCDKNIIVVKESEKAIDFLEDQINGKTNSIPDLILLETMIENGKGWDFIIQFEELVKQTTHPIKLVILTCSQFFSDFKRSTQFAKVDGFLIKPLQMNQLITLFSDDEVESSTVLLNSFIV